MWLTSPSEDKSVTLTFFTIGFAVALAKLLLAGMTFGSFTFGAFSGTDFAAVTGALGAVYAARRHTDANAPSETETK